MRPSGSFTLTSAEIKNDVSRRAPSKPFEVTRQVSESVSLKLEVTERIASAPLTERAAASISFATSRRFSGVTVAYFGSSSWRSTSACPS